jgi:hypothetical protein
MTKIDEMFAAFTAYQPSADRDGHGKSWARMCNEKTVEAADEAAADVLAAGGAIDARIACGAFADAIESAYVVVKNSQVAIDLINKGPQPDIASDDVWIQWNGGDCPVLPDTAVEIRFRDGFTHRSNAAGHWKWIHCGGASDIDAYRVIKTQVE